MRKNKNITGKFEVTKREVHAFNFNRAEYIALVAAELIRRRALVEIAKNNQNEAETLKRELEVRLSTILGNRRFKQINNSLKANSQELVNVTIYL